MSDSNSLIQIKGLRDGLLVSLADAPWDELRPALMAQIESQQTFFRGARVALDVGNHIFDVNQLSDLRDELSERGVLLWAVISQSPRTEKTSQLLGLATRIARPRLQEAAPVREPAPASALWLDRTLRSGTRIEYPGNVVVLGDVNPGAEIVADGSVIVWGRVRGVIHAGANGDESAVVCALDLSPTQLRICNEIASSGRRREKPGAEIVSLKNGRLQAERWQSGDKVIA